MGRRDMKDGDVQGHLAGVEQQGDLMEKNGHIISSALVDSLAVGWTDKQGIVPEVPFHLRFGQGIIAQEKDMDESPVFEGVLLSRQRLHKHIRSGGVSADVYTVPALDDGHGLVSAPQFLFVIINPTHLNPPFKPKPKSLTSGRISSIDPSPRRPAGQLPSPACPSPRPLPC